MSDRDEHQSYQNDLADQQLGRCSFGNSVGLCWNDATQVVRREGIFRAATACDEHAAEIAAQMERRNAATDQLAAMRGDA